MIEELGFITSLYVSAKRVTVYDDEVCAVDDVCGGTAGT